MENLPSLLKRFRSRELEVRRLFACDEDFRCACEDYQVAAEAQQHWERDGHNAVRAVEYRQIADEIADEIMARLDTGSA
jgi:hypothetical protein